MTLKVTLGTSLAVQCLTPCQCRGRGFNPWFRKIPCAMRQLSSCSPCSRAHELQILSLHAATTATTTKPEHLEAVLHNKRNPHSEKPKHSNEQQPSLTTGGSLRAATKTQCSQKRKKKSLI